MTYICVCIYMNKYLNTINLHATYTSIGRTFLYQSTLFEHYTTTFAITYSYSYSYYYQLLLLLLLLRLLLQLLLLLQQLLLLLLLLPLLLLLLLQTSLHCIFFYIQVPLEAALGGTRRAVVRSWGLHDENTKTFTYSRNKALIFGCHGELIWRRGNQLRRCEPKAKRAKKDWHTDQ